MKPKITTLFAAALAVVLMSFAPGKNHGIVKVAGSILDATGEKVENVRIKIFVDDQYHSYRFIEDGQFDFTLPKQGEVKLQFCHKTMAMSCVSVDTKISEKMKGAEVIFDMKLHPKTLSETLDEVHDFANEPVAKYKVDEKGVGFNEIETETSALMKTVDEQYKQLAAGK